MPVCDAVHKTKSPVASGSFTAAGEGTPTAEAKSAQQAVKLLSEFLSACYRLDEAKAANKSSSQPSDLICPSPAPTTAPAAVGKGVSPTGASHAVISDTSPTGASCAVVNGTSPTGASCAAVNGTLTTDASCVVVNGMSPTCASSARGESSLASGALAAACTGPSPIGASAAMGTSQHVEQNPRLPSGSFSMQQAELANAPSTATTSPMESDISRINSNMQRQLDGAGAVRSDGLLDQMAQVSHASMRKEALQTEEAEQGVQHISLPSSLDGDQSPKLGGDATGAQCVDMWRQACTCLIPQVRGVTHHDMPATFDRHVDAANTRLLVLGMICLQLLTGMSVQLTLCLLVLRNTTFPSGLAPIAKVAIIDHATSSLT